MKKHVQIAASDIIRTCDHIRDDLTGTQSDYVSNFKAIEQDPSIDLQSHLHSSLKTHDHQHGSLKTHDHQHGSLKTHDHQHGSLKTHDHQQGSSFGSTYFTENRDALNHSFEITDLDEQTNLQENKFHNDDIPWGYIHLPRSFEKDHDDHNDESSSRSILYINNTNYYPRIGEEGRTIFFQIKEAMVEMDNGIRVVIPAACNFDDVSHNPLFPEKHRFIKDDDRITGWELY